jgi:hypothetical protein
MGKPDRDSIEKEVCNGYEINGVLYLPHYREGYYIGPGFWEDTGRGSNPPANFNTKRYLESELVNAGAKVVKLSLWKRRH